MVSRRNGCRRFEASIAPGSWPTGCKNDRGITRSVRPGSRYRSATAASSPADSRPSRRGRSSRGLRPKRWR
ncbi:hypothetical protein FEZ61_18715 [Pseudomonas sp. MS15a(2019)]|nr:hypothetical protein [Pseudomonas sp. MS15a(2019)]